MAGRYVILEFEDKEVAEKFVGANQQAVLGMFMKPEKFCQCPDKRRQNVTNWVKGARTGLYLCRVCKKPSEHHQKGIMTRLKYVFGKNLLED